MFYPLLTSAPASFNIIKGYVRTYMVRSATIYVSLLLDSIKGYVCPYMVRGATIYVSLLLDSIKGYVCPYMVRDATICVLLSLDSIKGYGVSVYGQRCHCICIIVIR